MLTVYFFLLHVFLFLVFTFALSISFFLSHSLLEYVNLSRIQFCSVPYFLVLFLYSNMLRSSVYSPSSMYFCLSYSFHHSTFESNEQQMDGHDKRAATEIMLRKSEERDNVIMGSKTNIKSRKVEWYDTTD